MPPGIAIAAVQLRDTRHQRLLDCGIARGSLGGRVGRIAQQHEAAGLGIGKIVRLDPPHQGGNRIGMRDDNRHGDNRGPSRVYPA